MITDVLLAVLPIPLIWSLSLNTRTKFALNCVLGLGLIAVGAGAVKVHAQAGFLKDPDRLYKDRFAVWAAIELYLGIIAASLPTLKPLAAAFFSATLSSSDEVRNGRQLKLNHIPPYDSKRAPDSMLSTQIFSEYASTVTTPVAAATLDRGSYFSIFRPHQFDTQAPCTRIGSLQHGQVTWREDVPEQSPKLSIEKKKENSCIVRTTRVVTTTELRSGDEGSSSASSLRSASTTDGLHRAETNGSQIGLAIPMHSDTASAVLKLFEKP